MPQATKRRSRKCRSISSVIAFLAPFLSLNFEFDFFVSRTILGDAAAGIIRQSRYVQRDSFVSVFP